MSSGVSCDTSQHPIQINIGFQLRTLKWQAGALRFFQKHPALTIVLTVRAHTRLVSDIPPSTARRSYLLGGSVETASALDRKIHKKSANGQTTWERLAQFTFIQLDECYSTP
jgi:hypothetical protein